MHIRPEVCFCRVNIARIMAMARRRYVERIPTIDLLASTEDPEDRRAVALVSLLDVDEEQLRASLGDKATHADCDLLACRRMLAHQVAGSLGIAFEEVVGSRT